MIDIGYVANTSYNDGGALQCQALLHGTGSSCAPGLAYSPFGFKGRPRDPDVDAQGNIQHGALVLYWYEGSTLHTMPLDDGRRSTKLPQLDKGGSCWYGDTDGAVSSYDGAGNLALGAPKTATVTLAASGAPVKIGDNPQALALGPALYALMQATAAFAQSVQGDTALKAVAPTTVTAAQTLASALQLILNYQTTELTAT